MIKIELTEQDAELFKLFRQSQDLFKELRDSDVFNLRSGQVILHFNEYNLMSVEVLKRRRIK